MYYRIAEEGNGFKLVGSQDEKNDPKNYIGQANYSYNNTWISNGNMAIFLSSQRIKLACFDHYSISYHNFVRIKFRYLIKKTQERLNLIQKYDINGFFIINSLIDLAKVSEPKRGACMQHCGSCKNNDLHNPRNELTNCYG